MDAPKDRYQMKNMSDIEHRRPSSTFNLIRMEDIYLKADGKVDVPHRHDYYTVLLVEFAKGDHIIDFQIIPFSDHEVHFVSPGQVHQVALTDVPKGWAFTFSRTFLVENNIPVNFISNINLFRTFGESPPLQLDQDTFKRLMNIIQEMESCLPFELKYRSRALGSLLQLFLIYCHNNLNFNSVQLDEENASVCILRDFKSLIEEKYQDWHQVRDYAKEIHISAKHLSQTVKNITGKTAKTLIQDRLILEAKRLLLHSSLTIKEIAYQIGFTEPLHFSGFFKKKVHISPSGFRNQKTPLE